MFEYRVGRIYGRKVLWLPRLGRFQLGLEAGVTRQGAVLAAWWRKYDACGYVTTRYFIEFVNPRG